MPNSKEIIEEIPYRFKISGNLIKRLGEESIASKNIAILELLKNSFDAKASTVTVTLNNINTKDANIVISDNGEGMTNTDLENKWLNIATPNKTEKIIKTGERIPVGEKGIGRLSSESLGNQTILETKPKGESAGYRIVFDWLKYQDKNVLCNEVVNPGYKIKKAKNEYGTQLEISKLKHDWNDSESQKSLLKDIYLLHPPTAKPKKFTIKSNIKIAGLKKIDRAFLQSAAYHLKASLISGNVITYEISSLSGKSKKAKINLATKLSCGDATFELFSYYRDANSLKNAQNVSVTSQKIKEISSLLDEYGGVKIYRDSFRVKPYGEKGKDWLGLDLGYQNNSMYPRNNNVFGFVQISKLTNPKITDTTTREGIVFTNEFQDLISFVQTSIQEIFVNFRSEVEAHKKKAKKVAKKKVSKKITPVPSKSTSTSAPEKLIKDLGSAYPQNFYAILQQEINDCYHSNYPNAAFFLSRKLVENLVFNILEKKYPSDATIWYSTTTKSHHKFSLLISNLHDHKSDFKGNVQAYIEKFNTLVAPFRKEANSKAHNIFEYLKDKSELHKFKIGDLVQLLLNIYHNI